MNSDRNNTNELSASDRNNELNAFSKVFDRYSMHRYQQMQHTTDGELNILYENSDSHAIFNQSTAAI